MSLSLSSVKRDKIIKEERLKKRARMRTDLPNLTKEEIRRYRMMLHQALFCELEEQNLPSSAALLKQLIDYQKWLRKSHGPDSWFWARPRLTHSPAILNKLVDGFKKAEKAHYARDIAMECDSFLHLGVEFCFGSNDWWWLGEQLLVQSVNISTKYHGDGQRRLATSKYILGKFLFENQKELEPAIVVLKEARVLSSGHSWTAAKYLHCTQKTVFVESCIVLHNALMAQAKLVVSYDPETAITLCSKARRRAYDACDHEGEAKALMFQGNCELRAGLINNAAESFYKVLLMHTKAKRVEETCEARISLIQAYLKLGNWKESYYHLQQLLEFAQSHNMPYYIGQSYRYMGEYYLNHGNPDLATPLLIKALNAFHEIGDINNREQTKNFAAVSAGQELMPKYINFMLKCGQGGSVGWNYLQKLIRWKDTRDIAWSESSADMVRSSLSFEEALRKTGESGHDLNSVLESEEQMLQKVMEEDTELETNGANVKHFSQEFQLTEGEQNQKLSNATSTEHSPDDGGSQKHEATENVNTEIADTPQ
ncbi:hypothetical protein Trydic_g23367 [Trypoxylus dichotomus]